MVSAEGGEFSFIRKITDDRNSKPVDGYDVSGGFKGLSQKNRITNAVNNANIDACLAEKNDSGKFLININIFDKLCRFIETGRDDLFYESIKQAIQNAASSIWSILKKTEDECNIDDKDLILILEILMKIASNFTYEHSQRVMQWSISLAKHLQLDQEQIDDIKKGALFSDIGEAGVYYMNFNCDEKEKLSDLLKSEVTACRGCAEFHDIGKLEIPKEILNKTSKLSEKEFEIMKQHPIIGETLLKPFKSLKNVLPAVRHHHERWDGKGYPDALRAEAIPLSARIVALTDSFDAMISDRPYRKAKSREEAICELEKNSGTQFDPNLVKIFLSLLKQESLAQNNKEISSEPGLLNRMSVLRVLGNKFSLRLA